MIQACRAAVEFVEGMLLDAYLADRKTRFAVLRAFEMLGEAARHIPEPIKQANADIPWPVMAAVRNRIVHGYFGIDDSILFTTVRDDIRPLLPRLERLAREHGAEV